MGILLLITQGISLAGQLVVPTMTLAKEIKALFEKTGADVVVEIQDFQSGGLENDAAVDAIVMKWKADNGFV